MVKWPGFSLILIGNWQTLRNRWASATWTRWSAIWSSTSERRNIKCFCTSPVPWLIPTTSFQVSSSGNAQLSIPALNPKSTRYSSSLYASVISFIISLYLKSVEFPVFSPIMVKYLALKVEICVCPSNKKEFRWFSHRWSRILLSCALNGVLRA